jgi:hypothetical protein
MVENIGFKSSKIQAKTLNELGTGIESMGEMKNPQGTSAQTSQPSGMQEKLVCISWNP